MNSVTRYMVRYKYPYSSPAKYTTSTKFVIETTDGERKEYLCGGVFKNYSQFINKMKERFGSDLKVDRSKPYVMYQ